MVTRTLSKETAGVFFALTSIFLIAETVARLGTGTGVVYAISRARALGLPERAPAFVRVALAPVVVLSVVLCGVLLLTAEDFAELLTAHPGGVVAAIRVLAVLLPLTTISDTLVAATRGHATIVPTVVLDSVGRTVVQLLAVALVVTSGSLAVLSVAWAAPWAVCAVLAGGWLLRLQRPHAGAAPAPSGRLRTWPWREFWSFTAPRAVTSVVQLALQRLDIVLLTVLAGPVQAALYTAATRFLVVGQFANQALAGVVEPRLGRLLTLSDRAAANAVYQAATGWLVLLCWPLYLVVGTYADRFLAVFGRGYGAGEEVVLVLAGAMLAATSIGLVDVVLLMGGRTRWNLGNALVALTVNVGVDLVLIPRMGLLGAAVGWAAAILVKNLLPLTQVWRTMGMHPFGAGTGAAVALSSLSFGLLPLVSTSLFGHSLPAMAATTAISALCYVAGCWKYREVLALETLGTLRRGRSRSAVAAPDARLDA